MRLRYGFPTPTRRSPAAAIFLVAVVTATTLSAARRDLQPPGFIQALTGSQAGNAVELALRFVSERAQQLGLGAGDLEDPRIDSYVTKHNGATHVFLRQRLDGIEVWNGDIAVHVAADGSILAINSLFAPDLRRSVNATRPLLDATVAVVATAEHLGLELREPPVVAEHQPGPARAVVFAPSAIALQPITARLMYFEAGCDAIRLAWNVNLYEIGAENWWNLLVDAETGSVLARVNWVARDSYRIYELPARSPNHVTPPPPGDGRVVAMNPADPTASPYGWHSTTTIPGQYQHTRGNNVDAYEDTDNSNAPTGGDAARVFGSASLDFSPALDLSMPPGTNLAAGTANLFYMNNMIHDILYHYGFDEASGNFQVNNFGKGGDGGDDVQAEAQDGGGRNNANFATPVDGQRPRMQMYQWDAPRNEILRVNSPASIAGDYSAASAAFGPRVPLPPGITGQIVLVDDGSANPDWGCDPLINGAAIAGNIALANLSACGADVKAANAEAAGATALLMYHFQSGAGPFVYPGTATPGIPVVMIGNADGLRIIGQLPTGVNATLVDPVGTTSPDFDCDFDNEIVIHEYGHGLSNRLVGGRTNVDCLANQEQAGEGWSDLFALMLTGKPGDVGSDRRGIATYSTGQAVTGKGLRSYPYSTDLAISPLTYADIATEVRPHGTGSVWASAGWEVYWALTDRYGFNPDLSNGTGGNNMAIRLFVDGLKFTPCNPGFVDDRDAVLRADVVGYAGANRCLLWQAFAKRGLGFSARQGSATVVGDETEAFDVPVDCVCAAPVEQGNVLHAWRGGPARNDVELDFVGASGTAWRLFRDPTKTTLRTTPLGPDVTTSNASDLAAVSASAGARLYYRLAEVDCLGNAGP